MLSSNQFTSAKSKPHLGLQKWGYHCKIQGVISKTNKLLKKLSSSTRRVVTRIWDYESFNV